MARTIVDGLDLNWFHEARALISAAPDERALPAHLRAAWRFVHTITARGCTLQPGKGFIYRANGAETRVDGLTGQLARVFHPVPLDISTGGAQSGGSRRGCLVDEQIAKLVNRGELPMNGTLAVYTVKALKQLRAENLQPFMAQVCVAWREANIGTALDMVCIDLERGGVLINVQLKTGFDRNYERSLPGVTMSCPFYPCPKITAMPDSHRNRHTLQLMAEHVIAQEWTDNALSDSLLMIISERTHAIIPLLRDEDVMLAMRRNLQMRGDVADLDLEIAALRRAHAVRAIMRSRARERGRGKGAGASAGASAGVKK